MLRVTVSNAALGEQAGSNAGVFDPPSHLYRFANLELQFPTPVLALSSFSHCDDLLQGRDIDLSDMIDDLDREQASLIYRGRAPFADQIREVSCMKHGSLVYLLFGQELVCRINPERCHIHVFSDTAFDDPLNLELVTGPALILLMAYNGQFCVHASAAQFADVNIAFMAESGVGKSTLSKSTSGRWRQLADDIVPLSLGTKAVLLDAFPQLKLPHNVGGIEMGQTYPLTALLRLDPIDSEEIVIERLAEKHALLQLVRHTVGVKLFDQAILRQHMEFASRVSKQVSVFELRYPRKLNELDRVRDSIMEYFS